MKINYIYIPEYFKLNILKNYSAMISNTRKLKLPCPTGIWTEWPQKEKIFSKILDVSLESYIKKVIKRHEKNK